MSVACVLFFFLQRFEIINPVRVRSTFARSSLQGVIAIGEGGVYVGREGSYGEREADWDGKEEVDGGEGKFQRKTDHL